MRYYKTQGTPETRYCLIINCKQSIPRRFHDDAGFWHAFRHALISFSLPAAGRSAYRAAGVLGLPAGLLRRWFENGALAQQ